MAFRSSQPRIPRKYYLIKINSFGGGRMSQTTLCSNGESVVTVSSRSTLSSEHDSDMRPPNPEIPGEETIVVSRKTHGFMMTESSPETGLSQSLGSDPLTSECTGGNPRALSIAQGQEFATKVIRSLPLRYRFTVMGLFGSMRMRGKNNNRAHIINPARKLGLIRVVGVTKQDQQGRNGGYATLWEVVKNV